jgi:hypothetical protein
MSVEGNVAWDAETQGPSNTTNSYLVLASARTEDVDGDEGGVGC